MRNPETAECGLRNGDFELRTGKVQGNCQAEIANFELRIGAATMNREHLEERTKEFALQIVRFVSALPTNKVTNVLGYQLLKSGTSIGANYREASRAESRADFIHKIAIAEKEAAETEYWLDLFKEEGTGDADKLHWLTKESHELLAILTASGRTAKEHRK